MESIFIKGVQLLLSLSLLIVLHELGHFIPAKIFKTRVEKFFLFFDVKFALFKKKNWRYCLWNWLASPWRLCQNFWDDRRKHGYRADEAARTALGI